MKTRQKLRLLMLAYIGIGILGTSALAQTWQSAGPVPRYGHSAVLDTTTNRMLIFGGQITTSNASSNTDLNEVWRLNSNLTWTAVKPKGTPPAPRLYHSAVFDASSNRMIVFGGGEGFTSPCANDVWVLTNANGIGGMPTWTSLSPTGTAPAPRAQHGAVYDPSTNTMIVYGGQNCFSTIFGDVWVLSNANGLGGTSTWTQLSPTGGGPSSREITGGVAYDSTNNRLIVFGGSPEHNDVWVLSNANGQGGTPTWTQLSPSGTLPAARQANSTVYDPTSNRLTIFGGADQSNHLFNDVWVLTNANGLGGTPAWTQLGPFASFPEARYVHTGVYNSSTNKMTVFGGLTTYSSSLTTNDVSVLNHANGQ